MLKQLVITVTGLLCLIQAEAQVSYFDRPDLLEKVEVCLQHTYGFSFDEARSIQSALSSSTPGHPAPLFLKALIVYWENFPLVPSKEASKHFISLMDSTVELARGHGENNQSYIEGVFFDLFGRAFKAMYWADNGKSGKVIPDLGNMYRHTKKGFDLQEQFVEFYFSTGLYNYYIEAYPTAHPAFKPLVAFMQRGDRELGLKQLNHAIHHTVFLKVESLLFMSLIQLNYEEDLNSAAIYAERLVREYPGNIYYQGHLINILLHQHRYGMVRELLSATAHQKDNYSEMIRTLAAAFIAEKESGHENRAMTGYMETVELAETFGPFADIYRAMGYMGLSRLYEMRGLHSESGSYARKASRFTTYSFILDEQFPGSR
ncbi:MAG: hypothetical protein K8R52_07055 [Bacteroidales bacterium]|nr:hypothetical protein [Bacteroidales bacterium]